MFLPKRKAYNNGMRGRNDYKIVFASQIKYNTYKV